MTLHNQQSRLPGKEAAPVLMTPTVATSLTPAVSPGRPARPPVNVWAHGYLVVGTRGLCRLVAVVPSCAFCGEPHQHGAKPDATVIKRTASCHQGRYVVHLGTIEGQVAA